MSVPAVIPTGYRLHGASIAGDVLVFVDDEAEAFQVWDCRRDYWLRNDPDFARFIREEATCYEEGDDYQLEDLDTGNQWSIGGAR